MKPIHYQIAIHEESQSQSSDCFWAWYKQLLVKALLCLTAILNNSDINTTVWKELNNYIIHLLIDCRIHWGWRHYTSSKHQKLLAQWQDVTSLKNWIFFVINHATCHVFFSNCMHLLMKQIQQNSTYLDTGYPDRKLSGSAWPFSYIYWEFYKTNLPWNYQVSDQIQ